MLSYGTKGGFTYPITEMDSEDRDFFLSRLEKQMKAEERAIKKKTKR